MRPLLIILFVIITLIVVKVFILDADKTPPATKASTSAPAQSQRAAEKIPVDIYIAKEEINNNTVFASGTLVPNEDVEIKSEVSGRLMKLNIKEGSFVKKGDLIAKLNDEDLLSQLKRLQYEEDLANQIEARQNKLLAINAISKEEYDMAVNKVNTLSTDKEFLEIQLKKTSVRAPFSGRMGLKNISEGAYITPSVVIANLIQTNPIKVDFSIPEKYSSKIKVGQATLFKIDGDNITHNSNVIAIDPRIDEDLRTLKVRAKTNNADGSLLPGMFVRVEVPLGNENFIMIPSQAIVPILKGKKVYVMRGGKAVEVEITTGLRTDELVQVESGLVVGDSLIVSALMSMKENAPVTVRNVLP